MLTGGTSSPSDDVEGREGAACAIRTKEAATNKIPKKVFIVSLAVRN